MQDKHPIYEYSLYCRVGNAIPYIKELHHLETMEDISRCINEIEKRHNRYHQIFYIDNDFYVNQYTINQNGTYYKFLRRKVNDWEEFTTSQEEKMRDKIIRFCR